MVVKVRSMSRTKSEIKVRIKWLTLYFSGTSLLLLPQLPDVRLQVNKTGGVELFAVGLSAPPLLPTPTISSVAAGDVQTLSSVTGGTGVQRMCLLARHVE